MFGRKKKTQAPTVASPAAGRILDLEEVPDPVFSRKVMGDGFAVDLTDGQVTSPADGELVLLPDSLHAFAVRTPEGVEILVHIGIDTVKLKGEGFRAHRAVGDVLRRGDPVVSIDLDGVRDRVPSLITPVVITNGTAFTVAERHHDAGPGAPVLVLAAT